MRELPVPRKEKGTSRDSGVEESVVVDPNATFFPTGEHRRFGSCVFNCDCIDVHRGIHNGIDLLRDQSRDVVTGGRDDPIYAAISGVVSVEKREDRNTFHIPGERNNPGNTVRITSMDGSVYTRYLHLAEIHVSEGDTINAGTQIGIMGNTGFSDGMHLHFEVYVDGKAENPIDYFNW